MNHGPTRFEKEVITQLKGFRNPQDKRGAWAFAVRSARDAREVTGADAGSLGEGADAQAALLHQRGYGDRERVGR